MLTTLLVIVLSVARCSPGEARDACDCRQGKASACKTLRKSDPKLAAQLEKANEKQAKEEAREEAAAKKVATTGQEHHIISKNIAKALDNHPTLKGSYKPRDPRFVTMAIDSPAHRGYQKWHREVDDEVIKWVERNPKATPKQFESYLRSVYSRPEMKERFPNGF